MNDFNFKEWKYMQENPFTYFTVKIVGALNGIAFTSFIIFFCLYITDKIDWSLWFVTLPIWYGIPLYIIAFIIDYVKNYIKDKKNTRKNW